MSDENVDVARRAVDAWNRGDVDTWLETGHPEVEWVSAIATEAEGTETVYLGHVEMRRFWDEWHALWDLAIEITEVRDLGDTVVLLGSIRTRGTASGIVTEQPVGYVIKFEGGLMRKVRSYRDTAKALEAVGLLE